MSGGAGASCFPSNVILPQREAVLAEVDHGQGGREMMDAVFAGDLAAVERLAARDRELLKASDTKGTDVLVAAMSRCDEPMFRRLLALGAAPDGPKGRHGRFDPYSARDQAPLILALYAKTPVFAHALLEAGATPNALYPQAHDPLEEAVRLRSRGAVRLLLDHGAEVNPPNEVGASPLETALTASAFAIAEVLLDHGADPFAADVNGGTPANSLVDFDRDAEDAAAKPRVLARLRALGALPALAPAEVRREVLAGRWPPGHGHGRPPAAGVVATMRANWSPDGQTRRR